METVYFSTAGRTGLMDVIPFEGDYYEDSDIIIDVIGKVNTAPSIYDEEGNILEEIAPVWTDFLFNVIFLTDKYREDFSVFKSEIPATPIRTFL
jgi:hypothetical protein